MKKTVAILIVLVMVLSLAACGNGGTAPTVNPAPTAAPGAETTPDAAPQETITLRYADTCNSSNPDGQGNLKFIELVAEKTNGQVEIQYFDSMQLGSDKEITQSCLDGTLDMCKCSAGNMSEFSDGLAIFDLPGLMKSFEHARAVVEDETVRQSVIDDVFGDTGLYPMILEFDEPRGLATKGAEIRTPDQVFGKKLRSTGAAIELSLFKEWGASGIAQSMAEVYTSLQNGVIDGCYNQAYVLTQDSTAEALDNWVQIYQSWCLSCKMIGPSGIEKLGGVDSDLFKTVIACAREAEEWQAEQWETYVAQSHTDLVEKFKVNVPELTEDELNQWFAASESIWDQYVGEGKQFTQERIDQIRALA